MKRRDVSFQHALSIICLQVARGASHQTRLESFQFCIDLIWTKDGRPQKLRLCLLRAA
jgi:hypothetical protein